MPSSAAIRVLNIDMEHKGTLETEGSSQYFYWSMCSSLLETIDPLLVSNWPCCCCTTSTLHSMMSNPRHVPLCPPYPVPSLKATHNYWSSNDIITPKGLALITAFERSFFMSSGILVNLILVNLPMNMIQGKLFPLKPVCRIIVSVSPRPTSLKCLQESYASSVSYKHRGPNRHMWRWGNPVKLNWL